MPTKKIGLFNTGQTLFTVGKHDVGRISSISIDPKVVASGDQQITIVDQYSGDVTAGVTAPTVNSAVVFTRTVYSGVQVTVDHNMLDDIRTFGIVSAYKSTSTDVVMVVNYHYE